VAAVWCCLYPQLSRHVVGNQRRIRRSGNVAKVSDCHKHTDPSTFPRAVKAEAVNEQDDVYSCSRLPRRHVASGNISGRQVKSELVELY
jgi:hypothetical protein